MVPPGAAALTAMASYLTLQRAATSMCCIVLVNDPMEMSPPDLPTFTERCTVRHTPAALTTLGPSSASRRAAWSRWCTALGQGAPPAGIARPHRTDACL